MNHTLSLADAPDEPSDEESHDLANDWLDDSTEDWAETWAQDWAQDWVGDWTPPPARRSGIAGVVRLAPDLRRPTLPPAVQGTLALDLEDLLSPERPGLRLVHRAPEEVRDFAGRFAQGVIEVLGGDRHPHQLLRCTSRRVQEDLVRRAALLNSVARPEQRRRRLRAQVRAVHVQQQSDDAAEVVAVVRHGARCRAIAARVELTDGRWVCVVLELG